MFNFKNAAIMSFAWICNGRRSRLQFKQPGLEWTKKGGAVQTVLDSKIWQYSGTRSLEMHSTMGLTAIRLNWDQTQQWYSLLHQRLKVYLHCLNGVYPLMAWWSYYCTPAWHDAWNHRLCISSAFRWESPFGRAKRISKWRMTYSLSYDISCVCFFHCFVCW